MDPPRTRLGKRLRSIFKGGATFALDTPRDNKHEVYASVADDLDAPTEVDDEVDEVEQLDEETAEGELPAKLEQAIAAMITANPTLSKQEAAHHLLHTASGRSLFTHLNKKDTTTMPDRQTELANIVKQHGGLSQMAKLFVSTGKSHGVSEAEFAKLIGDEAARQGQSFAKFFTAPENADLRRAHQLSRGF
jgi:hypothetical protein